MKKKDTNISSLAVLAVIASTLVGTQAHSAMDPHAVQQKIVSAATEAHTAITNKAKEIAAAASSPEKKQAVEEVAQKAHAMVTATQTLMNAVVLDKVKTVAKGFLGKVEGILNDAKTSGPKVLAKAKTTALAMVDKVATAGKK